MKRYALNILAISAAVLVASSAFAKKITFYNETGYVLKPHQMSNEIKRMPQYLFPGKTNVRYHNLKTEEYVSLRKSTGPVDNENVYFGLDNKGFHGYTSTGFSYYWDQSNPKHIKVYVCDSPTFKACKTNG